MSRPDYITRRIELRRARQVARRSHLQPCDCPYCISSERVRERLAANLARNPGASREIPF